MEETGKKKNLRPSLFDAANLLSEICNEVDNCSDEELSTALNERFKNATTSIAESIDRRKYVYREAESKIELARQYKKDLDGTIAKLKFVQDRIEETTKAIVKANPDLPLKDSLGNRVTISSGPKALKLAMQLGRKSVSHILDQSDITKLQIPEKYLKTCSFVTLDAELLKSDLEAMACDVNRYEEAKPLLLWSRLIQNEFVRGLNT